MKKVFDSGVLPKSSSLATVQGRAAMCFSLEGKDGSFSPKLCYVKMLQRRKCVRIHLDYEGGKQVPFTYFTRHAVLRIRQRTQVDLPALAQMLDERQFVKSGSAPASDLEHLVFFSARDQACFVAVRNALSGAVVTVWPLEYQKNLAWRITPQEVKKAAALVPASVSAPLVSTRPTSFTVSVLYSDGEDQPKVKSLFKLKAESYAWDLNQLAADDSLFDQVRSRAVETGIPPARIKFISLRLGGSMKRQPLILDWSAEETAGSYHGWD